MGTVRNQIDYILVNNRFRNSIKRVTTYPGADIGSDHNPLVADISLKLKRIRVSQNKRRIDLRPLESNVVRNSIAAEINNKLSEVMTMGNPGASVESQWSNFKSVLSDVCDSRLRTNNTVKKQKWMTDHILGLMEERRKVKNDNNKYRHFQRIIKREIKKAKENWMRKECEELEGLNRRHDLSGLHRKIKSLSGTSSGVQSTCLMDDNNQIISDETEILRTWEKYITELFKDARPSNSLSSELEGPYILKTEIMHAIQTSDNNKACGPDEIPIEIASSSVKTTSTTC
jgi:hypothetical protein